MAVSKAKVSTSGRKLTTEERKKLGRAWAKVRGDMCFVNIRYETAAQKWGESIDRMKDICRFEGLALRRYCRPMIEEAILPLFIDCMYRHTVAEESCTWIGMVRRIISLNRTHHLNLSKRSIRTLIEFFVNAFSEMPAAVGYDYFSRLYAELLGEYHRAAENPRTDIESEAYWRLMQIAERKMHEICVQEHSNGN